MSMMRTMSEEPPFAQLAEQQLQRHFGLSSFRLGQAAVIESVMAGRNALVVMPTGAGKSLCYQLPAAMLPGVTLVVSPLISLMKDQVAQLSAKGISATYINSTLTDFERQERIRGLKAGQYKLVYVAPERFRSLSFLELVAQCGVELFAIDEAHCISQWGHDFRPDYALLGKVRKRLRPPRTVALTATATPEVQGDIARSLLLKDPQIFVAGFDRPNLLLDVRPVKGEAERREICAEMAEMHAGGIIYCSTRKAAEALHDWLKRRTRTCVLYHAGLEDDARHRAQDTFMAKEGAVAVATNAFGMGIDKPDIRYVIHAQIPRAVEAYYQEIGRAGRDGKPASATLLFNHADVYSQERLIHLNYPSESLLADAWRALSSGSVSEGGSRALADYLGAKEPEAAAALRLFEKAGALRPLRAVEFRELNLDMAQQRALERRALSLLKRMTDYAYARKCRRAFLLRYFGDKPPSDNCGKCDVCTRGTEPLRATPKPKLLPPPPVAHSELAEMELRRFRKSQSAELSVPAYRIFSDATLLELARALPLDRNAFLAVKGAGPLTWEKFGAKVVEISQLARSAR
jgi:ATP-dependent DNA helicase RecQ